MTSSAFDIAAKEAKSFTKRPEDEELLQLYGLYKQATLGDNNTEKPLTDFAGRYKWDAWNDNNGIPQVEAEFQYIALVQSLKAKYQ